MKTRAAFQTVTQGHSHPDEQRLLGGQAGRGVLLHQRQGAEAELMDGLVGVQRGEVRVHLAVVLGDVQAVGGHVLTGSTQGRGTVLHSGDSGGG